MPSQVRAAGWSLRLVDLLGAPFDEVTEENLARLRTGAVREDADLDFKQQRYGNSDQGRRDLAGDLAAMANGRGGLIVIGIRDEGDVAGALAPVELLDGEEAGIRQVAAGNVAPHLGFDVRLVSSTDDPSFGYYLLTIPPSSLRPHAVRKDRDLRYPLRDGTTTRWLSEPEVADMYRDRFSVASGQAARVDAILEEGLGAMDLSEDAFVAVALVPTGAGSMPIDLARVAAVERWARDQVGPAQWFEGFFDTQAPPGHPGVAAHRVTLTSSCGNQEPPSRLYTELYDDGAGFACHRLSDARLAWPTGSELEGAWITNETLLFHLARCLLVLGRHAGENCGAWGDALIEARVVSEQPSRLVYLDQFNHAEPVARGREHTAPVVSRHTAVVDGLARPGSDLLATTRLLATTLFQSYGSPEVRQITSDGRLRIRYFRSDDQQQLRTWAQSRGVDVTEESVAGE